MNGDELTEAGLELPLTEIGGSTDCISIRLAQILNKNPDIQTNHSPDFNVRYDSQTGTYIITAPAKRVAGFGEDHKPKIASGDKDFSRLKLLSFGLISDKNQATISTEYIAIVPLSARGSLLRQAYAVTPNDLEGTGCKNITDFAGAIALAGNAIPNDVAYDPAQCIAVQMSGQLYNSMIGTDTGQLFAGGDMNVEGGGLYRVSHIHVPEMVVNAFMQQQNASVHSTQRNKWQKLADKAYFPNDYIER